MAEYGEYSREDEVAAAGRAAEAAAADGNGCRFSLNRAGGSPEWPASCEVHPASYGCRFPSNQTGESPEWPACREVHLASYGLSVFPENQTGESPAGRGLTSNHYRVEDSATLLADVRTADTLRL